MTPERWQQVEEVLQAALDRSPHERLSFLNEACSDDEELRQETSSLVDAYDEAGDFIEEPAIAHDAHVLLSNHEQNNIGREIGPYRYQTGKRHAASRWSRENSRLWHRQIT